MITAANGVGPGVTQDFILTVVPAQAPAITSAATATFAADFYGRTFTVTSTGPPARLLPWPASSWVTFTDNGNGTATLSAPGGERRCSYPPAIIASNGAGLDATQDFILTVEGVTAYVVNSEDNTVTPVHEHRHRHYRWHADQGR